MVKENKAQIAIKKVKQFLLVGRGKPTKKDAAPKVYKMRLFAPNSVIAKSRFWTFMRKQKKIKHANGELIAIHEVLKWYKVLDPRSYKQKS
jgi:large subunit ribosomal protein L18Ae